MYHFIKLLIMVGLLSGCSASGPITQNSDKVVTGEITIQPVGGIVGAGNPNSRVRTEGRVPFSSLSPTDRAKVEELFSRPAAQPSNFFYRLTVERPEGTKTIDVPPEAVPEALIRSIHSTLD